VAEKSLSFDANVLAILACPVCHGRLDLADASQVIQCRGCGRAYPIVDGIPVLIAERSSLSPKP
jgi:uncharacterized protein